MTSRFLLEASCRLKFNFGFRLVRIIGLGGIVTAEDAAEFLMAGAAAIQVGTASYADPRATERLASGLESWCRSHNVEKVSSLTGSLEIPRA